MAWRKNFTKVFSSRREGGRLSPMSRPLGNRLGPNNLRVKKVRGLLPIAYYNFKPTQRLPNSFLKLLQKVCSDDLEFSSLRDNFQSIFIDRTKLNFINTSGTLECRQIIGKVIMYFSF